MAKVNYVKNADLLQEIILYKKCGIISEELGRMLMVIAQNYSSKSSFSGYTWKNDMVSDSVLTCIKYMSNFNPDRSKNAFAYITQICKNAFKAYIKNQNKHGDIKDACYNNYNMFVEDQFESYTLKAINYESIKNYTSEKETF